MNVCIVHPGQYPPMPKSDLARQGRVQVIEEMLSSDDEDNKALAQAAAAATHGRSLMVVGRQRSRKLPQLLRSDGTTDWERVGHHIVHQNLFEELQLF